MTTDDKLAAILSAVQTDPGNRGLARDPEDNLFTATKGDFQAACHEIAAKPDSYLSIHTGFIIPSADPPAFETDGPLGAVFLARALCHRPLSPCSGVIRRADMLQSDTRRSSGSWRKAVPVESA